MTKPIAIHKLSEQVRLTSRTLRHWESEGLFKSVRDADSGWRAYDENSIICIHITALLRKFDIPIKDIKMVLDDRTFDKLHEVITKRISLITTQRADNMLKENQMKLLLLSLKERRNEVISDTSIIEVLSSSLPVHNLNNQMEDIIMSISKTDNLNVRFITLPPMRVAYHIAVSVSPEEEAITPVTTWLKLANLMGTARLLGGNMQPMPSGEGNPYGYGICASIPEGVLVPSHLKEMTLPGGLYAMTESSDDIYGSWQSLMKYLESNLDYEIDDSTRLCFEEHIRNDNVEGSGNEYLLNLLEPVKKHY